MSEQLIQDIRDEMLDERLGISVEEILEFMEKMSFGFNDFVHAVYDNDVRVFDSEKELVFWLYDSDTDRDTLVNTIWDMYVNKSLPYDKDRVFKLTGGKVIFLH